MVHAQFSGFFPGLVYLFINVEVGEKPETEHRKLDFITMFSNRQTENPKLEAFRI